MNSKDDANRHSRDSDVLGDLIERFERAWEEPEPPRIVDFLTAVSRDISDESLRRSLVLDVIPIDLEHRWRCYARQAGGTISYHRADDDSKTTLPQLPCLEDYAAQFPELAACDEIPLELIVDEFRVRHYWGDRPRLDEYAARFGRRREGLQRALRKVLAEFRPLILKVYWRKRLAYSTSLVSPTEIGRQCPAEPPPFCEFETQEGQRLIIAPWEEVRVSRRHVYLERVKAGGVRISSRTSKGDIGLGAGRLAPGQNVDVQVPVLFVLGEFAIRLDRQ